MGAGGRMSDLREQAKDGILKRVPTDPPFSLSDLKKAIPAHCFERSVIRSSYYIVHDLIVTCILTGLWSFGPDVVTMHLVNTNWLMTLLDSSFILLFLPLISLGNIVIEVIMPTQTHSIMMKFTILTFANHFDPLSPIFTERERIQVVLSDLGIIGVVYCGLSFLSRHKDLLEQCV
ncbi:plastid delta12-fatty acid acetylenase [Tanacetum coccineum]